MVEKDEKKEWRKRDVAMAGAGGITMFALVPSFLGFTSKNRSFWFYALQISSEKCHRLDCIL